MHILANTTTQNKLAMSMTDSKAGVEKNSDCKCTAIPESKILYFPYKIPRTWQLLRYPYTRTCHRRDCPYQAIVERRFEVATRVFILPFCLRHFEEYQQADCAECWSNHEKVKIAWLQNRYNQKV